MELAIELFRGVLLGAFIAGMFIMVIELVKLIL